MIKPDDCTLSPIQYEKVRSEANRVLVEAGAFGKFPTPVSDIMSAANVQEVKEDVLNESFVTKIRHELGEIGGALRRALGKVLGLFDARSKLVFIDRTLHAVKQTFIKLHETAHGFLTWQRDMYAVVEDCDKRLDPDLADTFDREANVFASEVLFQIDSFIEEAYDHEFGIFIPVKLSRKYGASIYSSVRQYVSKSPKSCAVIVLNPPKIMPGAGFESELRRVVASPSFNEQFGKLNWPEVFTPDDEIGALVPIGKQRASGKRTISLVDRNGDNYECVAEAFTQTYQVFVLLLVVRPHPKCSIQLP